MTTATDVVEAPTPAPVVQITGDSDQVWSQIPLFEGKEVSATAAKVTSVSTLEIDDRVWRVDDFVKMEIEARVISVDHKVNERSGKLIRVHVIKAVDCKVVPWDD